MKKLNLQDVKKYVEQNINNFHSTRLDSLKKLKLVNILKRKNPYLFKAKNMLTAHDLVKNLLDAHLSSQEETIFGELLEELAIFICGKVFDGKKSAAEGIDLEFERDGIKYVVAIKSGPNWGNSRQIQKLKEDFRKAKRILSTNSKKQIVMAVNGCCYGRDSKPEKIEYHKFCGQKFWEFISGSLKLYTEIIEPLSHRAKERNEEFLFSYSQLINNFTLEFSKMFCADGIINWEKLVCFNSAINSKEYHER